MHSATPPWPSYPAKAGYPVRRSFSIHHQRSGILDHPLSRMMTAGYVACSRSSNVHVSSRDALAPELCIFLRLENQRAQGMPGARCTRSPCAKVVSTRVVTTGSPGHPAFPCAMVLTVSSGLSLVTGLVCHHRQRDAKHHRQLDASVGASGPHGFAVRAQRHSSLDVAASIASPRPTSVTIAKRPSCGCGMAVNRQVICVGSEPKYFCARGWTLIC
jgi:hypothetical protein